MSDRRIVWLVEDSKEDAEMFEELLETAGTIDIEFISARSFPSIADYEELLKDERTGAIILDERLGEAAGVPYEGIEVADHLRTIRPELPMYILTYFADDELVQERAEVVDAVIDKPEVRKQAKAIVARILRGMQRYNEALTRRQSRLKELIDRKISVGLNEEEAAELEELRAAIERPHASTLEDAEETWEKNLQEQEDYLNNLENITEELRRTIEELQSGQE